MTHEDKVEALEAAGYCVRRFLHGKGFSVVYQLDGIGYAFNGENLYAVVDDAYQFLKEQGCV